MSYLLRLVLPDRPGALGAVATALGAAGADIRSVDVVERSPGKAIDDFVVELPPDKLADSLVSAAATVPDVRVESIRPYSGQLDPHRELALLDALADSPGNSYALLANGVTGVFRGGWALVLAPPAARDAPSAVLARSAGAPEVHELTVSWWPPAPARVLEADEPWAPAEWARIGTELAVAPLAESALLVGRTALRWAPSELVRLTHLAGIAASVTAAHAPAGA